MQTIDVSESQSIDIYSLNFNKHVSNHCESPSIEINYISLSNITSNNHLGSDNIATRVKARNEKARKKAVHKKSQHVNVWNLGNTSSPESLSYHISLWILMPKVNKFTIHFKCTHDRCRSIRSGFSHFLSFK